ncbi:MAG: tetratricopeptide repeat protein [Bacteroidetes bacterium]|nr:tetratricopeptide repeat protein [Bacteroidota bacterium]
MKSFTPVFLMFLLAACAPDTKWGISKINDKEQRILADAKAGKIDSASLMSLLNDYETFAAKHPTDSISAEYLFRSADFYRYMRRPLKSIQIYEKISLQFSNHSKAPLSVFLQGFLYENDLTNYAAARAQYHRFIVKYPNHPLTKDVVITMQNLGKTPEQLVAEFKAREQADSLAATTK